MSEKLSEKDVAEIRGRVDALDASLREISEGSEQPDSFDISDEFHEYAFSDMRKLLADRDAHLADLKVARELIDIYRRQHCVRGIDNPELRCNCCRKAYALLERTK